MLKLPKIAFLTVVLCSIALPVSAQQQASVAIFPFDAMSSGDEWIASGLSRDLIEKLIRTPDLRPVSPKRVSERLAAVMPKKSDGPAWLPASVQRKVGEWVEADLVLIGVVGSSGNRGAAKSFLDGLSIVPTVTPEGSEAWVAAKLIDIHRGMAVSWAFAEGSRNGYFELQDAIYLQIIADLGIDPGTMPTGTIGRPTESTDAYRMTLQGEDILDEVRREKDRPKQWRRAVKRLRQSLKLDPSYARTYLLLGRALQRQGELEGALAAFGQASALDPNYAAPRMAIADLARTAGDAQREMSALQSVLEATPWLDTAWERIARLHEQAGRTERAAAAYDRAIRLSEGNPDRLYRAGSVHLSIGQFDRAIDYLGRAVAHTPGTTDYHVQLVRAYTRAGHFARAKQALTTATGIGAESMDLWQAAGELALETQDYAAAESAFQHVLEHQPGRMDAQLMVAKLRSMRGDHQAAIDAYTAALADGVPIEDIVESLANAYIGIGQPDKAQQIYADALTAHPDETRWLMARARILIESLRYSEAIGPLRAVLETDPDNPDALEWLASAYAAVGSDREAIDTYAALLRHAPDRSYVYPRLGDLNYRARDFEAARSAYRNAIDSGHETADVYAGIGLVEEELSRFRSARTAYRKAIARDSRNAVARAGLVRMRGKVRDPIPEPTASEWASRGRSRMEAGDIEGAIAAFTRSLARNDRSASVLNDLGTAHAMLGETDRARAAFEKAEAIEPTPETAYNLGRLSYQEGKASEAILNYQIALQRDETFLRAAVNLAALQTGANDAFSASKTLQDIRKHHPKNGAIAVSLANAHFQTGRLDRASRIYEQARELEGVATDAEMGLGNVALAQGDTTGAMQHYRSAIDADPENPDPRVNLGTVLIQLGDYENAVAEFRQALDLNPTDLALYLNLAVLYYHTEQYPEALEYCRAVIEQDASMIAAQRLIGDIAIATEQHDLAVQAYGAVLQTTPDDLASLLGIAEALAAQERMEEARAHWQHWFDLVGDDPAYELQASAITRRLNPEPENWFTKQLKELRSAL